MGELLFQPLTLPNGTLLKNRFFKSAMSETLGDRHQLPSRELIKLYDQWANEDIGVLVTGNVMIDSRYLGEPGNVALDSEKNLELFKDWAQAGKKKGTSIWLQLNHPGKQMYRSIKEEPIAPSAIPISRKSASAFLMPREMTLVEIQETIRKFIVAAQRAEEAGFSGVQLHAVHGYLINQFLSPADNHRKDNYGGSLDNRMRFLREIYQGIRRSVKPNFSIAIKLNASDFKIDGFDFEDCQNVVKIMSELGIDLIEISGGNYETPVFGSEYENGAGFLNYATALAKITQVPIVSTGGFRDKKQMEKAIKDGVSMIGMARPFVLVPNLVTEIMKIKDYHLTTPRLTTGISKLDENLGPIIGVSYYEAQMKRIANGRLVKWRRNAWPYLFGTIKSHGVSALRSRRR